KVWDIQTGQELFTHRGHAAGVLCVALRPDGQQVARASWDHTIKVWNALHDQEARSFTGLTGEVWSLAFSTDGNRLAVPAAEKLKVWDVQTGQELLTL